MLEERLAGFAATFADGSEWTYGIYRRDQMALIGSVGVHASIGPRALEIGYWIDHRQTRQGFATEATEAVTRLAFSFAEVDRLEIRCDPMNVPSAGIPAKLGYHHVTTLGKNALTPTGEPRDTMVWELTRAQFDAA